MSAAQISRRGFVSAAAGLTGIAVLVPDSLAFRLQGRLAPSYTGGTFPDGLAAGDPTPDGITLWSRVEGVTGNGSVLLEVATDKGFHKTVHSELVPADPTKLYTVKVRVTGLKTHTQYYYRFATKSKNSAVGKFRTALAESSTSAVKFAYFSCQEFGYGYFNAHALMAKDDVDFVVNLGDFVYQDVSYSSYPQTLNGITYPAVAVRKDNSPGSEALSGATTYEQYAKRYQRYRSDKDLQAMQASHAMISTWDDHEVLNDYAGAAGADGGNASRTNPPYYVGWSNERKIAAYQAWFDNMPTFPQVTGGTRLYHKAKFGKNLELFVLDERQYRDKQACGFKATEIDPASCTDLNTPERAYLGAEQMSFLQGGLNTSTSKWKVIANEVVAMALNEVNGKSAGVDDWVGYPTERESLLQAIRSHNVKNVVFATGDYHTFMAGQVRDIAGRAVATEFAGGSVTMPSNSEIAGAIFHTPGYGTADAPTLPTSHNEAHYLAVNPHMKEYDQLHHGYVLASATSSQFSATFKKLQTIRTKSTALAATKTYRVAADSTTIL
ncbi:MAG: alkaline phosphatase D family protein [Solirubrobacterales bacterium]|nr:alkaline phosphatase D family protein [Solirubrobacterales bacterium]